MKPRSLQILLVFVLALSIGFVLGFVSSGVVGWISGLGAEYATANTIGEITKFVEQHERWPVSWSELNQEPLRSVRVDWSLDVKQCDRYDVMTSVAPITESFYTYPHAGEQLDQLWKVVMKLR